MNFYLPLVCIQVAYQCPHVINFIYIVKINDKRTKSLLKSKETNVSSKTNLTFLKDFENVIFLFYNHEMLYWFWLTLYV